MECPYHEALNSSLTLNVEPVTDWTDLLRFERTADIPTAVLSDSILIEAAANDVLGQVLNESTLAQLHVVAVDIKVEERPGEPPRLDVIQLRTKDNIYVFQVRAISF